MCVPVWGLRDQVMCGDSEKEAAAPRRMRTCAPKLCRNHKQQLSVGDGGEGGTTRFIHYLFVCFFFSLEMFLFCVVLQMVAVTDS